MTLDVSNEWSLIKAGLKALLESHYVVHGGVTVFEQPPAAIHGFPALVLLFLSPVRFPSMGGGGMGGGVGMMQSTCSIVLFLQTSDYKDNWINLDEFMSRTGDKSIIEAMQSNPSWGEVVDTSWLEEITNTGIRRDFGGAYTSATFTYGFVKS